MHVYIVCVCLWLEVCKGCARAACLPVMFFVASSWRSNGTGWLCAQKEEERLRASIRRDNQKRRLKERAQHRGLSSSYLEGGYEDEEDDEDGLTSISAIKRNYKEKRDSEFWGRGEGGGGTFAIGYQKNFSRNSWSSGQLKNDAKTLFSTDHHLSHVIFANATVVAFVFLQNSRFCFHCYTQHEPNPPRK